MSLHTFLHSPFESAESLIIHFLAFVAFLQTATRIARHEVPHAKARAAAVVLFLAFVLLKSVALNEPEKRPNPTNSTVTTTTDEPSGVNHVVAAGIVLRRLQPLPEVAQRKGAPSRIRQVSIPAGGVDIGLLPLLTRPRLPRVRQREIQVDFSDFAQRRIPLERIPELHQDVFGVRAGHSFTPQQHGSVFAPGNATSPPSPLDGELTIQDPILDDSGSNAAQYVITFSNTFDHPVQIYEVVVTWQNAEENVQGHLSTLNESRAIDNRETLLLDIPIDRISYPYGVRIKRGMADPIIVPPGTANNPGFKKVELEMNIRGVNDVLEPSRSTLVTVEAVSEVNRLLICGYVFAPPSRPNQFAPPNLRHVRRREN